VELVVYFLAYSFSIYFIWKVDVAILCIHSKLFLFILWHEQVFKHIHNRMRTTLHAFCTSLFWPFLAIIHPKGLASSNIDQDHCICLHQRDSQSISQESLRLRTYCAFYWG
jgi:hypothetical protein